MKRPNLLKRLWWRFTRLFRKPKKSHYEKWLEREVELLKIREQAPSENNDDISDELFTAYVMSCIDDAKKIALEFEKQEHSGFSASLTIELLTKMLRHQPLTIITGAEDEWDERELFDSSQQNKRLTSLFRNVNKDGTFVYSYNNILVIVNEDDVWKRYAESEDKIGTLDDDDPRVKKYFASVRKLKDELNSKITFPFMHVTHYYRWNFNTEELEEVTDMSIKSSN